MKRKNSQLQRVVERFPAYPSPGDALESWLKNLTCTVHVARWFECLPAWRMLPRRMPHDIFFYVLKGRGEARIEGEKYPVRAGSCLHFPRGFEHEARHDPRHPLHILVLHYTALVDFSLALPDFLALPSLFDLASDPVPAELLREACRLTVLTPVAWQNALNAVAQVFLFRLIHHHGEKIQPANPRRLSDLARLVPVLRRMRESLSSDLSVEKYAAFANLSPPQFRRVFRRVTGQSPNQFLQRLRLQKAAALLRGSQDTIENISCAVGYNEPSFFSRAFRNMMGMAPGAYRCQADFLD